jgi:hypothetical protein
MQAKRIRGPQWQPPGDVLVLAAADRARRHRSNADDGDCTLSENRVAPPKVIGVGAPISVWISFEALEIPALAAAIGDQLTNHGASPQSCGHAGRPPADAEPRSNDHIAQLQRMLADLEHADAILTPPGRFDVVWRTALARHVVHGAVSHAKRRADDSAAGGGRRARRRARKALAAALQSRRDFDAVDDPDGIWL